MLAWMTGCASGAHALRIAASVGELRSVVADVPAWAVVPLSVAVSLAGVVALSWRQSRARSRWQAALDSYAEREIIRQRRLITLKKMQAAPTALGMSSGTDEHGEA
jgi:hypothetical protein